MVDISKHTIKSGRVRWRDKGSHKSKPDKATGSHDYPLWDPFTFLI